MRLISKSKKIAIILSYISVIVQALSTMLLTKFYLNELGSDSYGLYQMIYSVAQYILILDLGISTVMVRFIAEFDAKGDHKKSENFAFHFSLVVFIIILFIIIIGVIINNNLENIYRTLTVEEYQLSHRMFTMMIIQLIFTVIGHYFRGMAEAYEQYVFTKAVSICQILLDFVLVFILIKSGMGVIGIVVANTVVILANVLVSAFYDFTAIKLKIKFHGWDFQMLRPAALLMVAMLLQSVIGHVNSSVDKTILGIMLTKNDVTVYSIAATIVTMFNTLPVLISGVFQPKAMRMVVNKASSEELTDLVIKPGRFQFIIVGGFIAGFTLTGRDFITCWTGREMLEAWKYVIIIMLPNAIPLIQSTCLSILNAKNKRIFRSIILVVMTVINIIMTAAFIPFLGAIGAPLATGISYLIGHVIIINLYYKKKIHLNVFRMFKEIFSKTWICLIISFVVCLPMMLWANGGNWLIFIVKALIFCIIYAILLIAFGFNNDEKIMINNMLKKFHLTKLSFNVK